MRAREFITEESQLPDEIKEPMGWAYELPGLDVSNPYKVYRFGVAVARARSDYQDDGTNPFKPEWSAHSAAGECAVVVGMNKGVEKVIDTGLKMIDNKGGKKAISTPGSDEPKFVANKSPIKGFKGYPR